MLKYGMPDLRAFFDADVRWLKPLRLPPARHADPVRRPQRVSTSQHRYAAAVSFSFGDTPEMAELAGKKYRDLRTFRRPIPDRLSATWCSTVRAGPPRSSDA
jgi:hypothetical protein